MIDNNNNNIGEITRDTEMLQLFPNNLKNKKMCKHAVNKLVYLKSMFLTDIRLNKCVKVILRNDGMLIFTPDY